MNRNDSPADHGGFLFSKMLKKGRKYSFVYAIATLKISLCVKSLLSITIAFYRHFNNPILGIKRFARLPSQQSGDSPTNIHPKEERKDSNIIPLIHCCQSWPRANPCVDADPDPDAGAFEHRKAHTSFEVTEVTKACTWAIPDIQPGAGRD